MLSPSAGMLHPTMTSVGSSIVIIVNHISKSSKSGASSSYSRSEKGSSSNSGSKSSK